MKLSEYIPRLKFIDENCGNLQVLVNGKRRKKKKKFYKPIDVKSVTNATAEIELSMVFLVFIFFSRVGSK